MTTRIRKQLRKLKRAIQHPYRFVEFPLMKWCSKSPWRSSLYYFLFNKDFRREHHSVLSGKVSFLEKKHLAVNSNLRRNIHRIEKGLTTRERKKEFAAGYIRRTVTDFETELNLQRDPGSVKWAHDVLQAYFQVVEKTSPKIRKAYKSFREISYPKNGESERYTPYKRLDNCPNSIDYPSFFNLCKQRRSVRWFLPKKVDFSLIESAVRAAMQAPSACNRQAFKFLFFDEADKLALLSRLPMGTTTFAHNISVMGFLIGDLSAYQSERDRHLIYIDGSLAAMSFMFAIETLGLASCPINWPDIEQREEKLSRLLGLRAEERCIMCFAVGYADPEGEIPFSQKREKEISLFFNPDIDHR